MVSARALSYQSPTLPTEGTSSASPICRKLAIAPSTYHEHAAWRADPGRRPARARRDDAIRQEITRGFMRPALASTAPARSGISGAAKD